MEEPASIADLERLEVDIEEALISHIDKPADDSIIADLERRKLHLIYEIERLRRQYCVKKLTSSPTCLSARVRHRGSSICP